MCISLYGRRRELFAILYSKVTPQTVPLFLVRDAKNRNKRKVLIVPDLEWLSRLEEQLIEGELNSFQRRIVKGFVIWKRGSVHICAHVFGFAFSYDAAECLSAVWSTNHKWCDLHEQFTISLRWSKPALHSKLDILQKTKLKNQLSSNVTDPLVTFFDESFNWNLYWSSSISVKV